jgi:hypothetical protein
MAMGGLMIGDDVEGREWMDTPRRVGLTRDESGPVDGR